MPPKTRSHDDALDLDGLDLKPSGGKSKAADSDFEKELEALFAEELASSDEKPASAPPVGGPEFEEDALLLDDLVDDAPPAKSAVAEEDEDDILDLSAFAAGGEMELVPPEETPGGKDGDIDLSGLDELISGLGDKKPAAEAPILEPEPLDSTDMSDLLETLDVPKAAAKPVSGPAAALADVSAEGPEEELLELSLGDLVEEAPRAESLIDTDLAPDLAAYLAPDLAAGMASDIASGVAAEMAGEEESLLDLTLPDLSDPEPGRDLLAEQEQADMGGDLNLSLPDLADEAPSATGLDQLLDSGDLDMAGIMEGIESSAEEPQEAAPELSLDPQELLSQIPESEAAPVLEPAGGILLEEPMPEEPAPAPEAMPAAEETPLPLADAALGAAVAGAAAAAVASVPAEPAPAPASSLEARLAELATQVMGNSVAVVRLEGQLAEREKAMAVMEQRLQDSRNEAEALRDELSALRSQLEDSLNAQVTDAKSAAQAAADKAEALAARVEGAEKTAAGAGERLALLEDRQTQLDRAIFSEISRAVPREAARVIREEIAHLAASMRDE